MFTKKSISVALLCSIFVFGLILISATIPVGSSVSPQTVAAADSPALVRLADVGNTSIIVFQAEPTMTDLPTDEPAPTEVVVVTEVPPTSIPAPTLDPNDPADNPAAPGGVLTNILAVVVGAVVGALGTFLGMLKVFTMLKDNKSAENTIEQLVNALQNSFPATPIKSTLNEVGTSLQDAGTVLRDVTDGKME